MLKAPSTAGDQSAAKANVGRYRSKCPSGDFMSRMNRLSGAPS